MAKHTTPALEITRLVAERTDKLQTRIRLRAYELHLQRGGVRFTGFRCATPNPCRSYACGSRLHIGS